MKSRAAAIRSQIQKMEMNTIFFADDFGMENRQAVRVILSRLVKAEIVVRLGAGIYLKPRYSTLIHAREYPSAQEIAKAIAQKERARIAVSGADALHQLGLSTQVPTRSVFLTDGSPRNITLADGRQIIFKHTAAKNLAYENPLIGMIVLAMKEIGVNGIDAETRHLLSRLLESVSYDAVRSDIRLAPEWIQQELRELLQKSEEKSKKKSKEI